MKTGISKLHSALVLSACAFGIVLTSESFAGAKTERLPVVNLTARQAFGALGSARNSVDGVAMMGCTINSGSGISCFAVDSAGVQASCFKSPAPQSMLNVVMALNGDSYLSFMWDATGVCTSVIAQAVSSYAPKK